MKPSPWNIMKPENDWKRYRIVLYIYDAVMVDCGWNDCSKLAKKQKEKPKVGDPNPTGERMGSVSRHLVPPLSAAAAAVHAAQGELEANELERRVGKLSGQASERRHANGFASLHVSNL